MQTLLQSAVLVFGSVKFCGPLSGGSLSRVKLGDGSGFCFLWHGTSAALEGKMDSFKCRPLT